jgi:hypothetical protein
VIIVSNAWEWFLFAVMMEVILLVTIFGGTFLAYRVEQGKLAVSQRSAPDALVAVPERATGADARKTKHESAASRRDTGVISVGRNPSPTAGTRDGLVKARVTGKYNWQTLHVSGRPEQPPLAHLQQIAQLAAGPEPSGV